MTRTFGRLRSLSLLAASLSAACLLGGGGVVSSAQAQTPPPPLSAYGALPATELVALSPSGDRLAFVTVVGEQRAMAIVDLNSERSLGAVAVGSAKLRDLEWLDEERVLVTLSTTETLPQIGLDKSELYLGQVFNVTTGRIVRMLNANRKLFPVLMSGVYVRPGDVRPDVLVRAYELDNYGVLNLYRVDPDTGNARLAERMSRDVDDFLLDDEGRSIARSLYDERSRVWSLQVRKDGRLQESWRVSTPVDPPEIDRIGAGWRQRHRFCRTARSAPRRARGFRVLRRRHGQRHLATGPFRFQP